MNCHGCKWLDRYQSKGNGYCAMVVRSKTYRGHHVENGHLGPGSRVRKPEMERCELYEPGDFETRYQVKEVSEVRVYFRANGGVDNVE